MTRVADARRRNAEEKFVSFMQIVSGRTVHIKIMW